MKLKKSVQELAVLKNRRTVLKKNRTGERQRAPISGILEREDVLTTRECGFSYSRSTASNLMR